MYYLGRIGVFFFYFLYLHNAKEESVNQFSCCQTIIFLFERKREWGFRSFHCDIVNHTFNSYLIIIIFIFFKR